MSFIVRRRGVVGLYQGIVPTFARTIPSTAAYFGCYEWLRIAMTPEGADPSQASNSTILLAGGFGGFMYWSLTQLHTFTTVKTTVYSVTPTVATAAHGASALRKAVIVLQSVD